VSSQPARIGVVGKLPAFADYAHLGERGAPFEHLLDWMTEACEAGFRPPARGGLQAFAYTVHPTVLVGVLSPSRDAAGRSFPAAAAALLDCAPLAGSPQLLPLLLEKVWSTTEPLLRALLTGTQEELEEGPWLVAPLPQQEAVALDYNSWVEAMTTTDLTAMLFSGDTARAAHALATLAAAVAPYAGRDQPNTPLALQLPLGTAGGAAVCFWLDVLRASLPWAQTVPSFFWSHDGTAGQLIVPIGAPAPSALGALWNAEASAETTCAIDSTEPGWQPPDVEDWHARLEQAQPLADLLSTLNREHSAAPDAPRTRPWWNSWRRG
jgi:hypothetical protein